MLSQVWAWMQKEKCAPQNIKFYLLNQVEKVNKSSTIEKKKKRN